MKRIFKFISWFENIIITIALFTIIGSIFIGVVSRYVFNSPVIWSEELALFGMIWLVFFGSSVVIRERNHIRLDLLEYFFRHEKAKKVTNLIADILVIAVLAAIFIYGIKQFLFVTDLTTALQIPRRYILLAIPVSAALMLIRMAEKMYRDRKSEREAAQC